MHVHITAGALIEKPSPRSPLQGGLLPALATPPSIITHSHSARLSDGIGDEINCLSNLTSIGASATRTGARHRRKPPAMRRKCPGP